MKVGSLFIELLQVAVGSRTCLCQKPSEGEWQMLYAMCQQQAVAGIVYSVLDNLSVKGQKPPLDILYDWIGLAEQIKSQNILANKRCAELQDYFSQNGFHTCILKGQGNAMMYPNPLLRQCGDIDIWVDAKKEDVVQFVKGMYADAKAKYHHVDFPIFSDIPVEVHYLPSFSCVPWDNKRLQQYYNDNRTEQFVHKARFAVDNIEITIPTPAFNTVFQMSHMMRHFMSEGIGMRHLIDYYYLLNNPYLRQSTINWTDLFDKLGLLKFAKGIMWILANILGMKEEYGIVPQNKKVGSVILKEILYSGNFGRGDSRFVKRRISPLSTNLAVFIRNLNLVKNFPVESTLTPFMNILYGLRDA